MEVFVCSSELPKNSGVINFVLDDFNEFYEVMDLSYFILQCKNRISFSNHKESINDLSFNVENLFVCFIINKGKYVDTPIMFFLKCLDYTFYRDVLSIQFDF